MSLGLSVSGIPCGFDPQLQLRKSSSKVSVKMFSGNLSVPLLLKSEAVAL